MGICTIKRLKKKDMGTIFIEQKKKKVSRNVLRCCKIKWVLLYVEISNDESLNRAIKRVIQTKRYVTLNIIKVYGEKPKIVYNQLKQEGRKGVIFEWFMRTKRNFTKVAQTNH